MKRFNIAEAKAAFSSIVERVEQGDTVMICRRNIPVAKLEPVLPTELGKRHRTQIGWARRSGVRILADVTEPAMAETDWAMLQ